MKTSSYNNNNERIKTSTTKKYKNINYNERMKTSTTIVALLLTTKLEKTKLKNIITY